MFASNKSAAPSGTLFVEDVFSTWLYKGTSAANTITNGIDLAGKGGLVWTKVRDNAFNNTLADTVRGGGNVLYSDSTVANQAYGSSIYSAFGSTGYTLGTASEVNNSSFNYASWTFREAPNFFDVVTYTGNGVAGRQIAHNLGSTPGMILFKATSAAGSWLVWHRYDGTKYLELNSTNAAQTATVSIPTSSVFTIEASANGNWNTNGTTYVAYLFAHDTSSTGLIQCGAFTTSGGVSGLVNVGFEPQWVLVKRTDSSTLGDWQIYDNMRGVVASNNGGTYAQSSQRLQPNTSAAEATEGYGLGIYQQGFNFNNASGTSTYIYMAIRRGPMQVPTLGTSVFAPVVRAGTGAAATVTSVGFPPDALMTRSRDNGTGIAAFGNMTIWDRLRGVRTGGSQYMFTNYTQEERSSSNAVLTLNMNGYSLGTDGTIGTSNYSSSENYINYSFRRAPGFFDEVCYTGTGAARTVNHNLGVVPELMIVKARIATGGGVNPSWAVYSQATGNTKALFLDQTSTGGTTINYWNNTTPTSSVFSVFQADATNASATNYVAYLFASCPGVSKVGSYTGNGSSQTINCAFAAGARFVMIKRTDSTGDWYVWDTARGIVAGNDPYIALNTDVVEVTSNDTIDPASTGFIVNQVAATNVNVNAATYIFLAIA